ncbi:RCC1 and BTB domain-containing protein 1 [Caerostris extrusa]|uniref:RCC1 and BTB domain-containing protein 1 n=1 Tax=Caerostris extrusa TaxID=172846 RepID=A0AAV4XUL9_CAEEX|nr:RCC1 and BTB domain-containing protein 1 [Caerostris extrusa]
MSNIDKWLIFSILEPDFVSNIKIACVFGSSGNEALIVNKDDDVYALGSNCSGCLGLGDSHGSLEPRKVESLCKKGIESFAYGSGPHVLAITADGELFSWGHNGYCQLGNGGTNQGLSPGLISSNVLGRKVIEVACGSHHSIALTSEERRSRKCISVACGQTSSMAVLDNGEVYGWGYNGNGQLGIGGNANQANPYRVSNLQGVVVQREQETKTNQVLPVKIAAEIGRVVEIAASHYNHISAALTQTSKVYMWGQCRGQAVTTPAETPFHSLHDVFACFASPAVTWKPMELDVVLTNKVSDSVRLSFDEEETSDLKFNVDGKLIHVHKSILKIRCEHFRSMFQAHWGTIDITQFSYPVYRAFLKFLYTDEVDLPPEDAIGLLDLANSYCEVQLKKHCECIIKHGITVENVAMLYAAAIKYCAKR